MWQKLSVFTLLILVVGLGGSFISASGQGGGVTPGDITPATSSASAQEPQPFFVALNTFGNIHAFDISAEANLRRYEVGTGIMAAVGDFTGDRICDVMAFDNHNNLYRYVADAERSFSRELVLANALPAENFIITSTIGDTAVGDFNRDGLLDFAVSGAHCVNPPCIEDGDPGDWLGEGLVHIFLNQGEGNFSRTSSLDFDQFGERQYERIAGLGAADYDGDGSPDLFIQHYWNSENNPTYVAINDGFGNFDPPIELFENSHEGGTNALIVGDFYTVGNDRISDLIVGQDNDFLPGTTWFYRGLPGGNFEKFEEPAYSTNPNAPNLRDQQGQGMGAAYYFDNNNNLDVVAGAQGLGLFLFLGNGDGTFEDKIVLYDDEVDWFKVATPPIGSEYACFWNEAAATPHLYLPFLSQ
jgi:hypothetical protein